MWDLLEDVSLFGRPGGEDGAYDAHAHLARMVSVLGDPPEKLIVRERTYRKLDLGRTITNMEGNECRTMNQFWGGPFFDEEGKEPPRITLALTILNLYPFWFLRMFIIVSSLTYET